MCQTKASRFEEMKINESFLESSRLSESGNSRRRKISNARKHRSSNAGMSSSGRQESGYFSKDANTPKSAKMVFQ